MNTAVLISSCDKYSFIWNTYKTIFQRYWGHCPYTIYFLTNKMDPPFGIPLKTGDKGWSDGLIEVMPQIPEKNFIWLLEDYWFNKPVNNIELEFLISNMRVLDHIRLYTSSTSNSISRKSFTHRLNLLNFDESYRCSLNAGIWNKKVFQDLLVPDKNIWESEHLMTDRSRRLLFGTVKDMQALSYDCNNNMLEKGVLTKKGLEYLAQENIHYI